MAMNNRLLRPRASGSFLPSSLNGLEVWLDASQTSTVTLNGSTVSEWRDRRPSSSFKLGQPTAASQPTWVASSKNGLGGMNFAVNLLLATYHSGVTLTLSQPTTFFAVFQTPSTASGWSFWDGVASRQHIYGNTNTEMYVFSGASGGPASVSAATWYAAVIIYNGASSSYRMNTKTATTVNAGTSSLDGLVLGSGSGLRGDANEFGIFSRAVSDSEAGSLLNYLSKKWAITLS
jgi:hypothetical protein